MHTQAHAHAHRSQCHNRQQTPYRSGTNLDAPLQCDCQLLCEGRLRLRHPSRLLLPLPVTLKSRPPCPLKRKQQPQLNAETCGCGVLIDCVSVSASRAHPLRSTHASGRIHRSKQAMTRAASNARFKSSASDARCEGHMSELLRGLDRSIDFEEQGTCTAESTALKARVFGGG